MSEIENSAEFSQRLNESARLLAQNRPGEALETLRPLYLQAPTHPDVAINLGGAYILQRKWDRAVAVLSKAAAAHPDNAMLWTNLGAAHLGRLELAGPQQQEQAIDAYVRALQADPAAPNVHYHLGLIYKERAELGRARDFFQAALDVNPTDKDAHYWLDQVTRLLIEQQRERNQQKLRGEPFDAGSDNGAGA
ncbi:MAG: tetratricopeptide repeat protein [Chloroflexota bacterium]|nr:tetratricopeptide repeat protein [Chloroflexota bacterium]